MAKKKASYDFVEIQYLSSKGIRTEKLFGSLKDAKENASYMKRPGEHVLKFVPRIWANKK